MEQTLGSWHDSAILIAQRLISGANLSSGSALLITAARRCHVSLENGVFLCGNAIGIRGGNLASRDVRTVKGFIIIGVKFKMESGSVGTTFQLLTTFAVVTREKWGSAARDGGCVLTGGFLCHKAGNQFRICRLTGALFPVLSSYSRGFLVFEFQKGDSFFKF